MDIWRSYCGSTAADRGASVNHYDDQVRLIKMCHRNPQSAANCVWLSAALMMSSLIIMVTHQIVRTT